MSQFDNLPLPAIKDAGDFFRLIKAGETVEIPAVGDFVYAKFTDGEVKVEINGKSTFMESGDERRMGPGTVFRGVKLINETANDKSVVFVIGFGGFNRRIIQGDVSIEPILRKADGRTVADTRQSIALDIFPADLSTIAYTEGEVVRNFSTGDSNGNPVNTGYSPNNENFICRAFGGIQYCARNVSGNKGFTFIFNRKGEQIAQFYHRLAEIQTNGLVWRESKGWYCVDNPANNRIRQFGTGQEDTGTTVKTFDQNIDYMCDYFDGFIFVYLASDEWVVLDDDLTVLQRFPAPLTISGAGNSKLGFNDDDGLVYRGEGFDVGVYDPAQSYTKVDDKEDFTSSSSGLRNGILVEGERWYSGRDTISTPTNIQEKALNNYETKPTFAVVKENCQLASAILKTQRLPQTTANITVSQLSDTVTLTGELIKATLEFYFKRKVEDGYLDSIYTFDVSRDQDGKVFFPITSGNRSFLAAEISDDFGVQSPARIAITFDDSLKLGIPL